MYSAASTAQVGSAHEDSNANAWTLVSPRRKKAGKATARISTTAALATKIAADATAQTATARSHDVANPYNNNNNNNNNNNRTLTWKASSSDIYALATADAVNTEAKVAAITTAAANLWEAEPVTASAKDADRVKATANTNANTVQAAASGKKGGSNYKRRRGYCTSSCYCCTSY